MLRQPSPAAAALAGFIRAYQVLISPLFIGSCRFLPSCSEYARLAVLRFGALRGTWLALRRLVRCHPACRGGLDLVPERLPSRTRGWFLPAPSGSVGDHSTSWTPLVAAPGSRHAASRRAGAVGR